MLLQALAGSVANLVRDEGKNFGLLRQWMRQSFAGRRKNMRPDIKDGFDKAVAADAARTTAQREVQERARTERENFKADWNTREST